MRLPLKLNLDLVNLLREFPNSPNSFSEDFLKAVGVQLANSKAQVPEDAVKHLKDHVEANIEYILLSGHLGFAKIANLQDWVSVLKPDFKVSPINTEVINKTNILNKQSLFLALNALNGTTVPQASGKSTFIEDFTVEVLLDEKEELSAPSKKCIYVPLPLVRISLNSHGIIDINFYCYLCHSINKAFADEKVQLYPWVFPGPKVVADFSEQGLANIKSYMNLKFSEKDLESYIDLVTDNPTEVTYLRDVLPELETLVFYSVHFQNHEIIRNLEKLFIALLGHFHIEVRNRATLFLNILYDNIHWQIRGAYKTKIASVNDPFKIECLVDAEPEDSYFAVILNAYSFDGNGAKEVLSWHQTQVRPYKADQDSDNRALVVSIDLGKFHRAGFYDWKLVKFQRGGKIASVYTGFSHTGSLSTSMQRLETLERDDYGHKTKAIQGRYIVHPSITTDLQLHELYADYPEGIPGEKHRGNFHKIAESVNNFSRAGVNALYVMGAFERDYNIHYGDEAKGKSSLVFKRKDASPLAITNRSMPSTVLGGEKGLKELVEAGKDKNVKIILDFVSRVSSSRHHKKYEPYLLYTIDAHGKKQPLYGSDGRGWMFEETAVLNFRKKELWDLLIDETLEFIKKYNIDGIHIDNAELLPQIFESNVDELTRRESDGGRTYTKEDLFYGNLVLPNNETGYWTTDYQESFANPFFVKLCKTLWRHFPNFIIIGDILGGNGLEEREGNVIRSGPIPRLYKFPTAIASIYGQHLHRDGSVSNRDKQTVNALRSWYETVRKNLPSGSIVIQSTTSHALPYPALIFKRALWSVIDLYFFLPDIPMTFLGEEDGHAFRTRTVNNFRKESSYKVVSSPRKKKKMSKSATDLSKSLGFEEPPVREKLVESHSISERGSLDEVVNGDNQIAREVGPEYGFDLKKIRLHYEHRRKLRHDNLVLREGKLIPLLAEHSEGFHTHILSFARVRRREGTEIAIVAINFNYHNVYFHINLKNLRYMLEEIEQDLDRAVVKIEDWVGTTVNDYYTIYEFLHGRIETSLKPHASLVWGANVYFNDEKLYEKTIQCSIARIQSCIMKNQTIKGNEIASLLYHSVRDVNKLSDFVNNYAYILKTHLIPNHINPALVFNLIEEFKKDVSLSGKLYAFCRAFKEKYAEKLKGEDSEKFKSLIESINSILTYNRLGSLVFIAPELGRWSTQGGLGVMVDELSQGLVLLGEDVICISPYYERNRKGETGYLEKDPDDIKHVFNLDIYLDGKYIVGVHHGVVKGVKQYFLHNPFIFPTAYTDGDARYTMQQMSVMAKASMELLCYIKNIPSLVITNDWFTGLTPAYVKNGHFGDTFKGTKFFHIVHNLEPTYEGRLYPQPHEGHLEFIHKLPPYLFVDPYWKDIVLNPSRCAILSSDQWATVSMSYKEDLMKESPLSGILNNFQRPFGFPNGIPKEARLERLKKTCNNDHYAAKEALQKKYFNLSKLDDSVALFGFVGRITQQKGVHLILEAAETLIHQLHGKIQFLVGGPANYKDPYGSYCAGMMTDLARRHPRNFWAAPNDFFMDGTLVNSGCDFGLMPSLFEPGGIVQHEFFIGSTPVIAFRTGGLKDTVKEFDQKTKKGSGFIFEDHKVGDLIFAIQRAMNLYKNKEDYKILRKNAFEAVIDVSEVSRAWVKEFYRLWAKNFIDPEMIEGHYKTINKDWDPSEYKEEMTIKRLDQEATEEQARIKGLKYQTKYMKSRGNAKKVIFNYQTTQLPRPKTVGVTGNFDDWKSTNTMHFDPLLSKWNLTLSLQPGEYYYKFVVDDKYICSDDDPKINDIEGNINNYLIVNK